MKNQTLAKKRLRRRRRGIIVAAVASLIILFLLALLIDSTLYHGKVHAGVTVSGVQLGGLTPEEAKAALDLRVKETQKSPITLTSGNKEWTVAPEDVGTKVDTAATVATAMGASRESNFLADRFRGFVMYFKDKAIPLDGTIDGAKVDQIVDDLSRSLDVPPINAGLVFDGPRIKIVKGQKGRIVDREALASQLKNVLLTLHATELPVPMAVKDPTVQADDYDLALQQAMTMTGSPIELTSGDRSWTLDTEEIIAYMDFASKTQDGVSILVPYLSAAKMGPFLNDLATAVARDPVSATFKGDGRKAWVVPAILGQKLDPEKTAEALNVAVLDPKKRSTKVAVTLKQPRAHHRRRPRRWASRTSWPTSRRNGKGRPTARRT